MSVANVVTLLDTRYAKKGDTYAVKLRITFNRKQVYYSTIYELTESDYNKFSASRIRDELQTVRNDLDAIETNAKKVISKIKPFSFENFEKQFIQNNPSFKQKRIRNDKVAGIATDYSFDITPYVDHFPILSETSKSTDCISRIYYLYIVRLLEEERIGTARSYQDSYFSLKKFRGDVPVSFITVQYLNQYEKWMHNANGSSKTTIGIKLRALRAIFNEAIEQEIIDRKYYPFGRRRYRIPTSKGIKSPLTIDDVVQIFSHDPEKYALKKAKAYWFFCYLGNGMNPKDMAYLKFKNIDGEYLRFVRAKTERTTKDDPKIITVYISEEMKDLINEWGNEDNNPDNYIFPVLSKEQTALEQYSRVRTLTKFINDGMETIAQELGIDKKVNNSVCRKTFSTVMKRAGASTEFIQEALGHYVKSTTENYLGDFEDELKKDFSSKLLSNKI